jgi:hypothetical protein
MTTDDLRRLLAAPELVVVDLLVHALDTLRLALVAEHPRLRDDLDAFDDPPLQHRARGLLRRSVRFQRALRAYRRAARRTADAEPRDDVSTRSSAPTAPVAGAT